MFHTNVETTLTKVQKSSLLLSYEVNAVGPILVIKVYFNIELIARGISATISSLEWLAYFWISTAALPHPIFAFYSLHLSYAYNYNYFIPPIFL